MKTDWRAMLKLRLERVTNIFADGKIKTNVLHALPFWVASLITGVIAVGYTKLFNLSEGLLHQALSWHHWLIFILAPVNMLIGWAIIRGFAPGARGSGIPQVMAAIELPASRYDKALSKLLSIRVMIVKIISSAFMVLGGAAIGREGPTIQIAGSVFRMVHKWVPRSWPKLAKQNFIITGAAAGLAAAFNTPLGGIVFAIEELARIHISFFRSALFTAVIIAGLTAQNFLGPYLYLGYPDVKDLQPAIFFGVIAAAVIAGLLGSLMCRWILALMRWRKNFSTLQQATFIVVSGLIIAFIAFYANDDILGSGKNLMNETLFTSNKHLPWHTVAARVTGTLLSFNIGAAGGVFAPSLSAGASVGAWLAGMFGVLGANANILILSGMVGFLTGVTRTPFTSAILVLEMTDRHSVIFHLMVAALVANIVALIVDKHSLYEQLKYGFLAEAKEATGSFINESTSEDSDAQEELPEDKEHKGKA
jgi:H+/Cl- antiporter ClcA